MIAFGFNCLLALHFVLHLVYILKKISPLQLFPRELFCLLRLKLQPRAKQVFPHIEKFLASEQGLSNYCYDND